MRKLIEKIKTKLTELAEPELAIALENCGYVKDENVGSLQREIFPHLRVQGMRCEYSAANENFLYTLIHYDGAETKRWTSESRQFNINEIGNYLRQYEESNYPRSKKPYPWWS
jgi:hypothetical protein